MLFIKRNTKFKIKQIPINCFNSCISLENIIINENVSIICDKAFYFCTKLTNINFKGNKPIIGIDSFKFTSIPSI